MNTCAGARQAGVAFFFMGAFGLLSSLDPQHRVHYPEVTTAIFVLNLVIGIFSRTRLVTTMVGRRSLALPVIAFISIAVVDAAGVVPPSALGLFFVMIFLWIGQWHPPQTGFWFIPLAAAAYLVPLAFEAPKTFGVFPAVVFVVGGACFAGEALARQTRAVGRARRQQAEALRIVEKATRCDDLTGLGNRRLGNALLENVTPGDVIAVLDLDHFKRVNDTLGHAAGDLLLQEFGAFLRQQVPALDTVARMGGEEFLIVFPKTPAASVTAAVQALLDTWRASSPLATFSVGIALHAQQSPATTYAEADGALYEAKLGGRDRLAWSTQLVKNVQPVQARSAQGARQLAPPTH